MERITESEEKSRDIEVDNSDKETGIAENNTEDRDLRGEEDEGGIRDLEDLDFGDLDPADLGFTDPCFGDPGQRSSVDAQKAEAAAAKSGESGADSGSDPGEQPAEEAQADVSVSAKPEKESGAPPEEEKAEGSEDPKAGSPEEAADSDAAGEETAADSSEKEPPAAEPDPDADMKIRRSRKKRTEAEAKKRSKPVPPPRRSAASAVDDEDEDYYDEDDYDEEDYDDLDEEELEEERRSQKIWLTFLLVSFLLVGVVGGVFYGCTVKNVYVKGNTLYTSEEIARQVISDESQLRHNTVFLTLLYHTPLAPKIPFVEKVDVRPDSYDTITITVKDKKLAGYIPYGGRNIYFSADGITLENSPITVKGVTYVTGITLNEAEVGFPLSSENPEGLALVLEALKILRKYEIKPESVVLTQNGSVTMFIGDVKVILGRSDYELKIAKIAQILPYLEGRKGTIDLTNYTSSDQNIILK